MTKKSILTLILFPFLTFAQVTKPKLVVGIVVDQMRYDFLYKFNAKYSENGFKKLMNQGFNCRNQQYHYATTVTGPGHAHVYNGSIPAISGIVGNEWYDKVQKKVFYVVDDSTAKMVGEGNPSAGKMSPKNMKVSTITDQLRISNQFASKVIGIALKDRGAILPAGHTGQAYWYESSQGNWITSDYYRPDLPKWVLDFNALKLPESYTTKMWEPLMPIEKYTESEADDQEYEAPISGETKPVFPHKITMKSIAASYFGNELTKRFAMAAFEGENLGRGENTDFLAISFSSPDYVGHSFGPDSKEVEDIYLRLDRDIAELLTYFDKNLGAGNYTVFLTADHGIANIPKYLSKHNIPSGQFIGNELKLAVDKVLKDKYGDFKFITAEENYQLYLNQSVLLDQKISKSEVISVLKEGLKTIPGYYDIIDLENVSNASIPDYYKTKIANIYNPKRSGDLLVLLEPAWFSGYGKGTTHGTMYNYDTHVPLLFYGFGINKGQTFSNTFTCDIAPTIAQILKVLEPNGSVGSPIVEALKK